jgi:hypothetical protein
MFVISLATDSGRMKSVLYSKRSENTKDRAARISLTFRHIATHPTPHLLPRALQDKSISNRNDSLSLDKAPQVRYGRRHGGREEAKRLLAAFGVEKYESAVCLGGGTATSV